VAIGIAGGGLSAATGQTLTVDGVISGAAGTGSLTIGTGTIAGSGVGTANTNAVIGNGTVVLSGVNTYVGGTIVNPGTLSVSANANLGANASPVTLNGGTLQNTASFTDTHVITVGTNGGTINNAAGAGNDLILGTANTLVGSGSLSVTGGAVWLRNSNSFSGPLNISNGGIFEFGATNAIAPQRYRLP
jgi:fibronectin-binding autotransporter adhesin